MSATVIPFLTGDDAHVELDACPISGTSRRAFFLDVVEPGLRLLIGAYETIDEALDAADRLRQDGVRIFETARVRA